MSKQTSNLIYKTQFSHEEIITIFKKEHKKVVIGYGICLLLSLVGFVIMSLYVLPNLFKNGIGEGWATNIPYLLVFSLVISFTILVVQKLIDKKKIIVKIQCGEYDFIRSFYVLNFIAILNYKALLKLQEKYGR